MGHKVVVIGAGAVGCSFVYALIQKGLATEIVIIDVDKARVEGEVMDLSHGLALTRPAVISGGTYADCKGADLIVITAGARQLPGETRLDLIQKNAKIMKSICAEIKANATEDSVVLVVSNPVDVLTHVAIKELNFPKGRVLGSGTVLDSARFKYLLSRLHGVDPHSVHAYILGEHGDSEIAAWSSARIGGICLTSKEVAPDQKDLQSEHAGILQDVRDSAYRVIERKGSTYYAIGIAMLRITEAILRDEKSVLTVSTPLEGQYGLSGLSLALPCVVGRTGVDRVMALPLSDDELKGLKDSATAVSAVLEQQNL